MKLWLLLLCVGCSSGAESLTNKVQEVNEYARDGVQGCSWRKVDAGFAPREPEACYRVYTGADARLSMGELARVCDAPKLPTCYALRGSDEPMAYANRLEGRSVENPILRYELTEPLADGSCPPCEAD